jgi:hypothetical protein
MTAPSDTKPRKYARLAGGLFFLALIVILIGTASRNRGGGGSVFDGSGPTTNAHEGFTVEAAQKGIDRSPERLKSSGPPAQSKPVIARSLGAMPGALVCPDFATLRFVIDLYNHSWEERTQDAVTQGQSKLLRGKAAEPPEPKNYDCVLIPPGTQMMLEQGNAIPVVRVRMTDSWVRGVTLSDMFISQELAAAQEAERKASQEFRESLVAVKTDFQRSFPTLKSPGPNLRWYQMAESTILVIPYGPCVVIYESNGRYYQIDASLRAKGAPARYWSFGGYGSRQEAESNSIEHCTWENKATMLDPNSPYRFGKDLWFQPEDGKETTTQ